MPEVLIVKPGWFYEMWAGALKSMQGDKPHFEYPFSPADYKIPMVCLSLRHPFRVHADII